MPPNAGIDAESSGRNGSPKVPGNRVHHQRGYHLTSEGPYRELVTAMCFRNPNLRWSHIEYTSTPDEYGKVTILELREPYPALATRLNFNSSKELSSYLKSKSNGSMRRILLMEGVARNFVEVLGSHFNMDPAFFANQKRPSSWDIMDVLQSKWVVERSANLPSLNDPRRSFMIRYPELRHFPPIHGHTQLDAPHVKDLDGHRQVFISRRAAESNIYQDLRQGDFHNIGVVNRAASYWSRKYEDGGWDGQFLIIM